MKNILLPKTIELWSVDRLIPYQPVVKVWPTILLECET